MSGGEFAFIRQVRAATPTHPRVIVGPGDDCAVVAGPSRLLVTTDVLTEGVDFILAECGPWAVGRKAMAVNLSDIAAMGGRPVAAVVGLVVPLSPGGEGDRSTPASARSPTASTPLSSAATRTVGTAG